MPIQKITKEQVLERLKIENPWWTTGSLDSFYNTMKRRLYFDLFYPLVEEKTLNRATVLMGPRRVGKTVMLFHTIQKLIDNNVDPKKICYISVETPIYLGIGLEQLFKYAREAMLDDDPSGWYIFFDEIQYLKNWEVHLKTAVDTYRKTKFVASGSAGAALKLKSNESGAGRFTDFLLPPLTFVEYMKLKELDHIMVLDKIKVSKDDLQFYQTFDTQELNKHFINYINFGGYPEVIFSKLMQENPGRYIKQDIIDKILLRDLPSLYGISDVQELNSLFTMIAYNTGNEFSLEELSQSSVGISKSEIKNYIEYLEAAFLIKRVKRVNENAKKFKRDNFFKIYLTNASLRAALFSPLSDKDDMFGNLVETAIFAQWMHRVGFIPYYSRWRGGEVDMIKLSSKKQKPTWAVEIKWSNRFAEKPRELKSLIKFCKANNLKSALVTTIDKEAQVTCDGIDLTFIPAATYSYNVGLKTISSTTKD